MLAIESQIVFFELLIRDNKSILISEFQFLYLQQQFTAIRHEQL